MKKVTFLTAFFLTITFANSISQSQGDVKETRDVTGFARVSSGVAGDLLINIGPHIQIVIEGKKAILM